MRTVSYRLSDLDRVIIPIGKVAENEATQVRIDSSEVFADYPTAVPSLSVLNPSGESYPVSVSTDGVFVLWNVKDSDLTAEGDGEFQLSFTVNTTVVKSSIGHTHVCRSIVAEGEAPDPIQNWLDDAEQTLAKIDSAIPEGGTTGQVLAKKSDTDYDTEWVDQTGGGGGGTSDYTQLTNKPQIAGVTLTGNKSLHDLGAAAESDIPDVSGFYTKPSGGIPATDIAEGVIPDVSGFYTKPSGGIPASDLASAVQTSLGKADTAYQKPGSGIPASDIASGVIPDPTSIIDDTAGDGDTNKVWSADKSADLMSAIQQVTGEVASVEKASSDIASILGQASTKNRAITGDSTYRAILKLNLYANVQYYLNIKLKSAASSSVYIRYYKNDGTYEYIDSISTGNSYIYKTITSSVDLVETEIRVMSSADFEVEYANLFSSDDLLKQIGMAITGDDITMLTVNASNKKTINGGGAISTETDSTMYVSDEIEIKPGHWYMVTGSAGYSASYYAIYDANHNCMMAVRSPSGSGTTCINKMVYMPPNSKYIRVAYTTSLSGGHVALCNTIKTRKYEAPEWWRKFLAISYSDIGIAHTNSLETFISAGHFGFPVCKGDVRPTSDNKLIMCHDGGFTFDGNGRITVYDSSNKTLIHNITHTTAMTYEYAGQNTASENNHYQKVTDIDHYLQVCKQYGMIAFITVREDYISTVCPEVIAALKRNNMLDRAIINSYTAGALSYIRMLDGNLPLSYVQSDNYNLGSARVNAVAGYGNAAITLVSTPANMRTYLTGLASAIALANTKGVGIMYAQPQTAEDVLWLREHGIMGAQIGRPCLPYQFRQVRFKISIASGTATLAEWFNMNTMGATVSQSSNTISVSEFKEAGSENDFSDLIMEYWMNKFPYRITATSENGNSVTAVWQNNALKLTVSDISVNDTIGVMIEV